MLNLGVTVFHRFFNVCSCSVSGIRFEVFHVSIYIIIDLLWSSGYGMDGNPSIFSTAFYSLAEEPNFCCLDPDMGYWGTHGCGVMGWSNQMGKAFSQHRQYVLGETLMMGLSARLPEMKFFKIKHK